MGAIEIGPLMQPRAPHLDHSVFQTPGFTLFFFLSLSLVSYLLMSYCSIFPPLNFFSSIPFLPLSGAVVRPSKLLGPRWCACCCWRDVLPRCQGRQATLGICTTKFRRLKRAVADSMGSHSEQMFSSPCAKTEAKKGGEVPWRYSYVAEECRPPLGARGHPSAPPNSIPLRARAAHALNTIFESFHYSHLLNFGDSAKICE